MTYWIAVPLTVLLALLQVAAAPSFVLLGVHPDLAIAWLACWGALRGIDDTLVLATVAGVSLGLLAPEPVGASLIALLPVVGLATLRETPVTPNRFLLALLIALVGGILYPLLLAVCALIGGDAFGPPLGPLMIAPRVAILDAAVTALLYWPLWLVARRQPQGGGFARV